MYSLAHRILNRRKFRRMTSIKKHRNDFCRAVFVDQFALANRMIAETKSSNRFGLTIQPIDAIRSWYRERSNDFERSRFNGLGEKLVFS